MGRRGVGKFPAAGWRKMSRGQAGVEFATTALVMLIVTFGIFVSAMSIYAYNFVSDSARDAVRYAIVNGSNSMTPATSSDIDQLVLNMAYGLDQKDITVTTTWTPNNNPGSVVSVQVTYNFMPLFPLSSVALPLTSSSQMVISH